MRGAARRLFQNLLVYGVGSFLIRGIQFLILPLVTSLISPEAYGTAELWASCGELLYPILTLGIYEAVFRCAVDAREPAAVLRIGLGVTAAGGLFWLSAAGIAVFWGGEPFLLITAILAFAQGLRMIFAQYVRGRGWSGWYILSGVTQALALLLLLPVLLRDGEAKGYLMSVTLSQLAGAGVLALVIGLSSLKEKSSGSVLLAEGESRELARAMFRYALPMLPTALCWWVINLSGRYLVLFFYGSSQAGLYAAAGKAGTAVHLLTGIFQQAWNHSASQEWGKQETGFFAFGFRLYWSGLMLGCSGVIALYPLLARLLLRGSFGEAANYLPLTIVAAALHGGSVYFGGLYVAAKRPAGLLRTVLWCMTAFLVLGVGLTPVFGVWGTLFASVAAHGILLCLRHRESGRWIALGGGGMVYLLSVLLLFQAFLARVAFLRWGIAVAVGAAGCIWIVLGRKGSTAEEGSPEKIE